MSVSLCEAVSDVESCCEGASCPVGFTIDGHEYKPPVPGTRASFVHHRASRPLTPEDRKILDSIPVLRERGLQETVELLERELYRSEPCIVTDDDGDPDLPDTDVLDEPDLVNSPPHYQRGGIECIDAIEAMIVDWPAATAYRLGNAVKYIFRHRDKGGLESLQKAQWYIQREIAKGGQP